MRSSLPLLHSLPYSHLFLLYHFSPRLSLSSYPLVILVPHQLQIYQTNAEEWETLPVRKELPVPLTPATAATTSESSSVQGEMDKTTSVSSPPALPTIPFRSHSTDMALSSSGHSTSLSSSASFQDTPPIPQSRSDDNLSRSLSTGDASGDEGVTISPRHRAGSVAEDDSKSSTPRKIARRRNRGSKSPTAVLYLSHPSSYYI